MKKKTFLKLGEFALAILLVMMIPVSALACISKDDLGMELYSGAWQPTDDSVFAIQFGIGKNSAQIYDYGAPDTRIDLFNGTSYANIYFTEVTENGISQWYADTVAGGQTLSLGENAQFGISFSNDKGTWDEYILYGASGGYTLIDPNTHTALLIHDADTVNTPLPGAILLLGSGLFGLTVARRKVSAA